MLCAAVLQKNVKHLYFTKVKNVKMISLKKIVLPVGVCCVLLLVSYSNTLYSPPVLDDFHSFVRNPSVHVDSLSLQRLKELTETQFGIWRTLPMITFAFDYKVGGGSIVAFHLTNILIHLLCFLSCFWMLKTFLDHVNGISGGYNQNLMVAFAVSALWALHPAQTAAVTYLVQRMAALQALFFFCAVASYLKARSAVEVDSFNKSTLWWCLCLLFSLGAFLSKENSAMLPIIFLVIEIWVFHRDLSKWFSKLFYKPVGILLGVVFLSTAIVLCVAVVRYFADGYSARHFTMTERLLTETRVIVQYMHTILLPNPNSLSLEHDVPLSTSLLSPPTTFLSILCLSLLLALSIICRHRYPSMTFGWMWFFINLIIESTIVPLELKFDHRMYLPSVGLLLAIVETIRLFGLRMLTKYSKDQIRKLAWSSLAIACSALSLLTFYRNEDWQDIISINRDAVQKAPYNPRAHANYSVALGRAGRFDEAIAEAQWAMELGKDGFEEYFVAGTSILTAYMQQGKWEEAIEEGKTFLQNRPRKADVSSLVIFYLKLADSCRLAGKFSESYRYIRESINVVNQYKKLKNDRQWIYIVLYGLINDIRDGDMDVDGDGIPDPGGLLPEEWIAQKLYNLNDYEGATAFAQRVPASPVASYVLSKINLFKERSDEQENHWSFTKKCFQYPWRLSNFFIGVAYATQRQKILGFLKPAGKWLLNKAVAYEPFEADFYLLRGWYAFDDGDVTEACREAQQAIALAPQWAKAWIALGFFEQQAGRVENALTAFQHTLELYPGYPKRQVLRELMAQLEASQMARPESVISMQTGS